MYLIVGLGNPGVQYSKTRHNVGFMLLDSISEKFALDFVRKTKFSADISVGGILGKKVVLCKPQTFMNLSGESVLDLVNFYKIPLKHIIVIHDDIDLDFLKLKIKIGGGSAGHNGIKSIDNKLGDPLYYRLRIGIGRPDNLHYPISDFVLRDFTQEEYESMHQLFRKISNNISELLQDDKSKFLQKL